MCTVTDPVSLLILVRHRLPFPGRVSLRATADVKELAKQVNEACVHGPHARLAKAQISCDRVVMLRLIQAFDHSHPEMTKGFSRKSPHGLAKIVMKAFASRDDYRTTVLQHAEFLHDPDARRVLASSLSTAENTMQCDAL